jgi:hypothetical protein
MRDGDERRDWIKNRLRELNQPIAPKIDDQELKDRSTAAERYAGEDSSHFVDYLYDCVSHSVKAHQNIRQAQKECWAVYNEEEPANFANKEPWQSRVVLPRPMGSVQSAMAEIRKSFTPEFLSIDNPMNEAAGRFWEKLMLYQFNKDHANFPGAFSDASGMAFAIGQSMEMIPVWRPGRGLDFILVEPWKIHRDPDAFSRKPQSGMYWIHQEFVDLYALFEGQKKGIYKNISAVETMVSENNTENPEGTQAEIARRKDMVLDRSKFRKAVLVSEFWGVILDKNGRMLLPSGRYTVAGTEIIRAPSVVRYKNLRWPGTSFSPIPNFLRFDGRGLLHGVRSLWNFMCSLMALHADDLNWLVNPMVEISQDRLVDKSDIDIIPGKPWLVTESVNGNQVVRVIQHNAKTNEILAELGYADQNYQRGSMVNDAVQGLPGYRKDMTLGESEQNLNQSRGVFGLIGSNMEDGALYAVRAAGETIMQNVTTIDDIADIFTPEEIRQTCIDPNGNFRIPPLSGQFSISGMSSMIKDAEVMSNIQKIILPFYEKVPNAQAYIKLSKLFRSIEVRTNLKDEGIFVDAETGKQLDAKMMGLAVTKADQEVRLTEEDAQNKSRAVAVQERQAEIQEAEAIIAASGGTGENG